MMYLITLLIGLITGMYIHSLFFVAKDEPLSVNEKGELVEFDEADIYNDSLV